MGLKDYTDFTMPKQSSLKMKSVKSKHPCKSVMQTMYDIVKAHGGEIRVNTKENEGTEFTIQLPMI